MFAVHIHLLSSDILRRLQNLKKSSTCFDQTVVFTQLSSVKTSGRYFQSFETFLKSLTLCNNKSHQKFRNYFTPMYLLSLVSRSKWRKRIQAVVKKLKPWPPRSVIRGSRVVKRGPAYYRTNSFSLTLEFRS